jgi:hypothetical protein
MSPRPEVVDLAKWLKELRDGKWGPNEWAANRPARLRDLEKYINLQIQINLVSWNTEMKDAINLANYPTRPDSHIFWWIALAGNMLWAATCFISPPAAATAAAIRSQTSVIQLMSVAGAAVGSGAVDRITRKLGKQDLSKIKIHPEDGKDIVRNVVGIKRATLEDIYKAMRANWASVLDGIAMWESASRAQEPLELYDKYIWTQMFPRIAYDEQRFNTIRDKARAKVEGVLASYEHQWTRWVTAPMMPQYHQAEALWAMGTLAQIPKDRIFQPDLKFDFD